MKNGSLFNILTSYSLKNTSRQTNKAIFLSKLEDVKILLKSGNSLSTQVQSYNGLIERQISESTYKKYCQEYLKNEYEFSIKKTLVVRNLDKIAEYVDSFNNLNTTSELYIILKNKGSLKKSNRRRDSSIEYEDFTDILSLILNELAIEHKEDLTKIIKFDKLNKQKKS